MIYMKRKNLSILVVGGAGYIGSYVNHLLNKNGYDTIILDNMSRGSPEAVTQGKLIVGDLADRSLLQTLFSTHQIDAVMHFAAFTDVGESIQQPFKYYTNNVVNTLSLLEAMNSHGVKSFIFSSTAAVYGIPQTAKITENHPCHPINPYGETKLAIETILPSLEAAYGIKSCSLRYFNAAGADPMGKIKNVFKSRKESNLIPVILKSLKQPSNTITINGVDYPTPDGTCIRDYIHIADLASAHLLALEQLLAGAPSGYYNLGNGHGFSVREVISAVEKVTGINVNTKEGPRRPGDPAILLADATKAEKELGWKCNYPQLEQMVEHAWKALS